MTTMLNTLAMVLVVISGLPYLRDTLRGKTKPNIVSWFTWTLLTAIGGTIALIEGELGIAMLTYANTLSTGSIVIAGLRYGYAEMGWFDAVCQLAAIAAIGVWQLMDSPLAALLIVIVTDAIGLLPTLRHSYLKPGEETLSAYLLVAAGSALALLTLDSFAAINLLYPVYLVCADMLVAVVLVSRRACTRRVSFTTQ